MSTRGTITIKEDGEILAKLYNHYDSYPTGLGKKLAQFALSGELVNGLSSGGKLQFNGAGCFGTALIAHLKEGPGGLYLCPQNQLEEYNYTIDIDGQHFKISCKGNENVGPLEPKKFLAWTETAEGE